MKQRRRDSYNRYYHAHKAECNLSTKKSKLHAKGVVKKLDIDLTQSPGSGCGSTQRRRPSNTRGTITKCKNTGSSNLVFIPALNCVDL